MAGKVPKMAYCEEAFGFSFEKRVLYAWSRGIGTTWIGGTMDRALFEKAAETKDDEVMMIVSPLGYPSAANMQPCRIVKVGNAFHFYEKHMDGYKSSAPWDVQKIDMGIALCHFMSVAGGKFSVEDPEITPPANTEYIATVTVQQFNDSGAVPNIPNQTGPESAHLALP